MQISALGGHTDRLARQDSYDVEIEEGPFVRAAGRTVCSGRVSQTAQMAKRWGHVHRCVLSVALVLLTSSPAHSGRAREVPVLARESRDARLRIEVLDDGLLHFEFSPRTNPTRDGARIPTTPMVLRRPHDGPGRFARLGAHGLATAALRVRVDAALCLHVIDLSRRPAVRLTTLCPEVLSQDGNVLSVVANATEGLYGLGEHFGIAGQANGDLAGRVIAPGIELGNALTRFNGGFTGNAQFPVLYALGRDGRGYALFIDQLEAQTWDLTGDPWRVRMGGAAVRGYVLAGGQPAELRRRFMALVGRPTVPPKKMFGLWVSEFGFDDWAELGDKLRTLRASHFPVDGFVLDLQWFGGVFRRPSHMGALDWDPAAFPDPAVNLARLRAEDGVGVMTIEESYVDSSRPELAELATRGYLTLACEGCGPLSLASWWGSGGMLDWTNPAAADYWHDLKRQPLIDAGVLGHWTDLGEPEDSSADAVYHGFPALGLRTERDVHDAYNLAWIDGIARGYRRNRVAQRPFVLSRSGTAGVQRFGAAMWSGDIGANLSSLAAHLNVQMHMSFSGVDYFGADVGGYHRAAVDGDLNEMYTVWLANAALLDVPVRPHTENLCNCKETAPDRIGDLASNRENIRLRYRLIPYLYSLAHRAHRYGEPVVAPLPLYYPADANVRGMADEKLLGRDLLVATVSTYAQARRAVYLPAGTWIDVRTAACVQSAGQVAHDVPTVVDGAFSVPLFARAGAIVPEMYVDEHTMNALGMREDGGRHDELILRIYADDQSGERRPRFTLYEDDGETVAYLDGAVRRTVISQRRRGSRLDVVLGASVGTYAGAVGARDNVIELVTCGAEPTAVALNGMPLERRGTAAAFDAGDRGWFVDADGIVRVRTGRIAVAKVKRLVVRLARR
jgi:alpha-glucosidase (family GH31 glycosyl hydrolase)